MLRMIKRLINVSGKYKSRINTAFVFSFLKSMLTKAPIIIGFFVISDFISNDMTKTECLYAGIAILTCVALQCIFQHIADRLQSAAGFMIFSDMRMKLGEHLRHLPMGYFTEGNIGKISSVLSTDMVFIEENCMMTLADMMSFLFSQLIMIVFLLIFDWRLGVAAIIICAVMLIIGKGMTKDALAHSKIRQTQSEHLTDAVLDFAEGIGIIKTYNMLGEKSKELTDNFNRSCKESLEFEHNQSKWAKMNFLCYALGTSAILAISCALFHSGIIELNYFIGMLLFMFDLFVPLRTFYAQLSRLTVTDSCLDRIEALFAEPEMQDIGAESLNDNSRSPEIEFRNVRFGYGEKEILHGVSFNIEKNEMLALVGPSGGGKSTIASLLPRFWDVKSGQILLKGTDIRSLPLSELMDNISMVFQRVYLFQDTVYNNISIGRPEASKAEVIEAAKKARCYDFIMELPDGFDTVIGEGGASLSGGQAQRLSIARCILKDAPIVILDEATASIDADNESYIQSAITELCKGKTLLVIAHRLNTIANADKILVVSDGSIAESGTHTQLMQKQDIYHSMVTKRADNNGWKN